jgi:hypothetical protein
MVFTTISDLQSYREAIITLAQEHGASNIRVFGSVARGEAVDTSDVDFLVTFDDDVSLLDRAGLWLDLQDLLGCSVDVVDDRAIKPRLRESILRDAVHL